MSSSLPTTATTAVFASKLTWESSVDAEKIYDIVDAEFKTKTILEGVNYVFDRDRSDAVITLKPRIQLLGSKQYASNLENHEKSVRKLNVDASKAMGILMSIFNADCNCHRSLVKWFTETIDPPLITTLQRRRLDFNFRNAYAKWVAEYRPNKQFNLDQIQKDWEKLDDRHISFARFKGQWFKFVEEMKDIGHEPTEEKKYEHLRKNVTNPHLGAIVLQLSYAAAKRISLDDFFDDCLHVTRTDKDKDSGREDGKRKHEEEAIVGRSVTLAVGKSRGGGVVNPDIICWRCGEVGHVKFSGITGDKCHATVCTLCRGHIGREAHDAKTCCSRSFQVFAGRNTKFPNRGKRERSQERSSSPFPKGKKGKKDNGKDKSSSYYGPRNENSSSTSAISSGTVPKDLQHARALVASLEAAYNARSKPVSGRHVRSAEEET